jgi:hypothetical protein
MPFNNLNAQGDSRFSNFYRQSNPIRNLQGQVGGPATGPLPSQVDQPAINPGMASISPSPEMINRMINQPLPPSQPMPQPMNRSPMPPVPMGNPQPVPQLPNQQGQGPQQMRRPMFPTANGRMGY